MPRLRASERLGPSLLCLALAACHAEPTLVPGPPREGRLAGGQSARLQLELTAGETARVVVEQRGVDLAIRVLGPEGRVEMVRDAPTTTQGPEPVTVLARRTGRHTLELAPVRRDAVPGRFKVELLERRPVRPEDHLRVAAEAVLSQAGRLHWEDTATSLAAAEAAYAQAGERFRRLGDERLAAWADLNRGEIELDGEKAYRGIARIGAALATFRRTGDRGGEAEALGALTYGHAGFGDREAQLATGRQALALRRELEDPFGEANTLHNLAFFYESLGEPEEAERLYREALTVMRRAADRFGEAYTLTNLGRLLTDQGRLAQARAVLENALALRRQVGDRRGEGRTLTQLGAVEAALGRPAAARVRYRRASELLAATEDLRSQAEVARLEGELAAQEGRLALARQHHEMERALAVRAGDPVLEAEAIYFLARVARREGRLAESLATLERAVALIEDLRLKVGDEELRGTYLASVHRVYELAIEIDMELAARQPARRAEALAWSQRAQARALFDSLAGPRTGEPDRHLEGPVLSVTALQRELLDADTVLLQYALGEERSFLWAVSRDSFTSFELPGRQTLEAAVREVDRRIGARNRKVPFELPAEWRERIAAADASLPRALERLGRLLLGPLWTTQAGRLRRLAIVGDGALLRVPFAALPGPDGRPLVASRELILLPSAAVLAELRRPRPRRASGELAVVADPVFSSSDPRISRPAPAAAPALPRLPGTRREALAVAGLVPAARRLLALDFAAERRLATSGALDRYRILHLATHALVNERDPRLSGVVLSLVDADGRAQDGVLRLEEIARLDLDADLVVLSACRTALGRELRGEGLLGLTRAFLHAGARRVMATLWEVQDEATAVLMERFYRAYLERGLPPGEALRQAQQSFLADPRWSAPYYWSGFVLEGEWK